jgi:hypothetical protein
VDIFGSVWLKKGERERGIVMEGRGGERFNRLLFAWLRGVEGERFYLREWSNLLFMPLIFCYSLFKNILVNVFKLYIMRGAKFYSCHEGIHSHPLHKIEQYK